MHVSSRFSLLLLSAALAACTQTLSLDDDVRAPSLAGAIATAAERHGVPASLIYAAGHVETHWWLPEADHDGEHGAPSYTRLGLREDQLEALAVYSDRQEEVTLDDDVAIDAFAAALAAARIEMDIAIDAPLVQWLPALARVAAPEDELVGESWALEVLHVVARGFEDTSDTGEILALPGGDISEEELQQWEDLGFGAFYVAGTDSVEVDRWLAARTGHWHTGRNGVAIDRIIIHTIEGSYDSAISWFRSSANPYNTSAHYVVRDSDGHITQMVREANTAYHSLADTISAPSASSTRAGPDAAASRTPCTVPRPSSCVTSATAAASLWIGRTSSATSRCRAPPTGIRVRTGTGPAS